MQGCSIRALWVLNLSSNVVFSRRFPTVNRRWQVACKRHKDSVFTSDSLSGQLPTDSQIEEALRERKAREYSIRGRGLRDQHSSEGSDSWVDDPITQYVISLQISLDEDGSLSTMVLWPLVLHMKGNFYILVLPFVEPKHLAAYQVICKKSNCGSPYELCKREMSQGLSSILLELPCITGAFMIARTIGDLITGDTQEPEVFLNTAPSGGGLLDQLTVGIGITTRTKPITVPVAAAAPAATTTTGATGSLVAGGGKTSLKAADKDALRSFISTSMPFGIPLDMAATTIFSMRSNGFSVLDVPPTDQKQPAWKPYLYKGKQRILFTVSEVVSAALYDREDVPDTVSIAGQVNCRAELEGLPDVSIPISYPTSTKFESFSYHPCCQAQAFEQGQDKQIMFSPPLGSFVLLQYITTRSSFRPPVQGFYQLSMVSENEAAFLFKLRLMEGYKAPYVMEQCTITMPFPRRKIVSLDGNPSLGSLSAFENLIEWKLVIGMRALSKSTEVTFPGTIKFGQWVATNDPGLSKLSLEEEIDIVNDTNQPQDSLQETMTKEDASLSAVELDEPFCWEAYNYAKAAFRLIGGSMSGLSIDPKNVSLYPPVKIPCEVFSQVISGDYILWNTLGRYPHVTPQKSLT